MNDPSKGSSRRPNVIWVFGDQHRAQALGFMGDPNLRTPNIDRLACEGVVFPNAVAGTPLCCPYRGSLLTSRYAHHCVPGHEHPLPDDARTIAHSFGDAGYDTAYIGKWHVDGFKERTGRAAFHTVPAHRRGGFGTWIGYENNNSPWDSWIHGHQVDGTEIAHQRLPGYETDCLTDLFISYLEKAAQGSDQDDAAPRQPFFAVLSVQPPHGPNIAPDTWMDRHTPGRVELRPNVPQIPAIRQLAQRQLAGYYAQIENLDWNLGRIREALDRLDLTDDTWIIFFSDHGDMMGSHGLFAKTTAYAESLSVPCIIAGGVPFYDHRRGTSHAVINHVDLGPTSLGLCGIDKPEHFEGTDFASHVRRDRPRDPGEQHEGFLQFPIPTGHGNSVDRPWRGIFTTDGWKYVVLEGQPWLMFNTAEDPYEQRNLALNPSFAVKRKELQDRLVAWLHRTDDTFNLPAI